MPTVLFKPFAGQGTGQSGHYMLPHLGSIKIQNMKKDINKTSNLIVFIEMSTRE